MAYATWSNELVEDKISLPSLPSLIRQDSHTRRCGEGGEFQLPIKIPRRHSTDFFCAQNSFTHISLISSLDASMLR